MRLSIIIAAHNEGEALVRTIQSCVETCTGLDYEIVVADDASWDGSTDEVERRFPRLRVVRNLERLGVSPAKDRGARAAAGEVLIFLDGHAKPERGALRRLVEDVQLLRGRAVIAPSIVALDVARWRSAAVANGHGYQVDLEAFRSTWLPLGQLRLVQEGPRKFYESPLAIGCALAVSRELYETLWGFDPEMRIWGVEDVDFSLKCWLMGHSVLHDPEAVVGHRFQRSFGNYDVPREQLLANQLRLARKNFTHTTWETWVARRREEHSASLPDHPEGLWTYAWQLFESRRPSAEEERAYLLARRVRDEFWYAERFGLAWPRLHAGPRVGGMQLAASVPRFQPFAATPSPCPPPCPDPTTGCHCVSTCPCEDGGGTGTPMAAPLTSQPNTCQHIGGESEKPVRYFNGEIQLAVTDLSAAGFGADFGHTRIFSNRLGGDLDSGNGYNWLVRQLPQLVEQGADTIMVLRGTRSALWFDLVSGVYVGRYGTKFTLTHDTGAGVFNLAAPNGEITVFNDFASTHPGLFKSQSTAGGQLIQVTSYAPTSTLGIGEVQRSYTSGGVTTVESFLYGFTGADLASVTLRRQVGGGAWQNIRQAVYAYYGSGDANGLPGDLQSATVQTWNGTAWQTIDDYYYRYWTADGSGGLMHCLKYALGSAAYQRIVAAGLNPLTATDAQLAGYADLYLEYDADRHVTKETVDGGLYTYTFSYATNGNAGYVDAYNNWKIKTVETRPDGSTNTVYTNYVGDVLLKQMANGSSVWLHAEQFDSNANVLQYAYPSAVTGFNDAQNDLAITYQASSGLIRKYAYYGSTAPGYVQSESAQQGTGGTPVVLKQYQYGQQSAGGATVYPTTAVTVYRDDAGTQPITTSYSYTFYTGTTAVQQRTTTLPVVPASQNGSGVATTRIEQFDQWGNPASLTDERGTVTNYTVDVVAGGLTRRTDDATGLALVTDFTLDSLGRTTQQLGPSHTIDLGGTATVVRTATWAVYDDVNQQVRTAQGYATGTAPSYTYTLVNPVSITIMDGDGNLTDQVQATRASTSGPLLPSDTFAQSRYVRWTHNVYNDNDQLTATRLYFSIPASGDGVKGTNYNEQDFGFDALGRQNKAVSGGGTITRTAHDPRNLPLSIWVGTNDTGATDNDPTGGGAAGNNMVAITINQYDGGASGGDGNLTQQTLPVDSNSANDRVTTFRYDWRDRQVRITLPQDSYQVSTYDTLDRVVQVDQYSQADNNLIRRSATNYDNRGQAYQSLRYAVDPSTGTVGNVLTDNNWYDAAGNVLMQLPAGSQAFTKSAYDALGRRTVQYIGLYSGSISYSQAEDISGATIVRQSETAYDEASDVIQTTTRQRFHNATGLGPLTYPGGAQPQARVTYSAMYPDGLGREQATADYGTNGDAAFTRPDTIQARSDTVLVTSTLYNDRDEAYQSIAPAGTVTRTTLDDAARQTQLIQNYQSGQPSSGDVNVTVNWTYTADDLMATMTAVNADTGDQTTMWDYGTTLPGSDVARNDVLSSMVYADSGTVSYLVNRQSEVKQLTDQNGTVHAFDFDFLGRQTFDRVTTLGTGIDATVQRIGRTYEVRGLLQNVTSYSDPTVGSGSVVNDVGRVYNPFEQETTEYQEHSGTVNPSTSVNVQYQYADGSSNTIRATAIVYPNGRTITAGYGTVGGIDDALSRVASLIDQDGTHLADYTRIGAGTFVERASPQPQISWSLINGTGVDPYSGFDRFNRIVDNRWYSTANDTDLDRIQHGYDRASNRLWRKNTVAEAAGVYLDELYAYDGLYRLARLDRGQLNGTNTGIVSGTEDFTQAWGLDPTGNWASFDQADTGGSWTLQQARTSNAANEITNISGGGWVVPAYDATGNMTTMPQPATPTSGYAAVYDAWNRPISLIAGGTTVGQYAYDGENRRISKVASGSTRHFYYSSQWQDFEERIDASTTADRQFVWGLRYIDELVLRDHGNERLYGLQDPSFNVVAVCDAMGAIQERYCYTAYGYPAFFTPAFTAQSSSAFAWDRLFSGYLWDSASSVYCVRRRTLHPLLGVWLSRDTLSGSDSANLYGYALNRPTLFLDTYGATAGQPVPCTQKDCKKCVPRKWRKVKDPTLQSIYCLLTEDKFLRPWKSKCAPNITCCGPTDTEKPCDKCGNKNFKGGLIIGTQDIGLCSQNFNNYEGVPNLSFGACDDVWETLRHELIHLLDQCTDVDKNLPGCASCICDEYRAHDLSGQCDDGSIWRLTNPNYKTKKDCLRLSLVESCIPFCPQLFKLKTDKARIAFIDGNLGACTLYTLPGGDCK